MHLRTRRQPLPGKLAWLLRAADFVLLVTGAILFGGSFTAVMQTGHYGFSIPAASYFHTTADFFRDAIVGGLCAWLLLALFERLPWIRQSLIRRALAFGLSAMFAMYLGPPPPILFGNTWTTTEVIITYLAVQPEILLALTAMLVLARCCVMQHVFKDERQS